MRGRAETNANRARESVSSRTTRGSLHPSCVFMTMFSRPTVLARRERERVCFAWAAVADAPSSSSWSWRCGTDILPCSSAMSARAPRAPRELPAGVGRHAGPDGCSIVTCAMSVCTGEQRQAAAELLCASVEDKKLKRPLSLGCCARRAGRAGGRVSGCDEATKAREIMLIVENHRVVPLASKSTCPRALFACVPFGGVGTNTDSEGETISHSILHVIDKTTWPWGCAGWAGQRVAHLAQVPGVVVWVQSRTRGWRGEQAWVLGGRLTSSTLRGVCRTEIEIVVLAGCAHKLVCLFSSVSTSHCGIRHVTGVAGVGGSIRLDVVWQKNLCRAGIVCLCDKRTSCVWQSTC